MFNFGLLSQIKPISALGAKFYFLSVGGIRMNTTDSFPAQKALELVTPEYFDRLIVRMERSGYKLFSRVSIDTNDCEYHVEANYARETALFFHLPNKKLIIHFVFREHDNPSWHEPTQYWTISFYPVFKSIERLVEMTYVSFRERGPFEDSNPLLDTLPLYAKGLDIPGFRAYGGHKYEQKSTHNAIDPKSLGTMIVRLLYPVLKYLAYGKFKELQVTAFWPYYTFHDSNSIFWSRFNNEAFLKIVERPWGGEPIKRY